MIRIILPLLVLFFNTTVYSQLSIGGEPKSFRQKTYLNTESIIKLEKPELSLLFKEDSIDDFYKPRRFGVIIPVNKDFFEESNKIKTVDGNIFVLRISSKGAQALMLYSDDFYIPKGCVLYLYNKNKSKIIGGFTDLNNNSYRTFATEMIEGDEIILEYYQPDYVKENPIINITEIGYAYRDFELIRNKSFGDAGSCNVNVNCLEGEAYRNEQRGITRIQIRMTPSSIGWCSGSLINNTNLDLKPYVLSAAHCIEDMQDTVAISKTVFYFNYEAPACSNITSDSQIKSKSLTGASIMAYEKTYGDMGSDFLLLLLYDSIPKSYNPYWNGWDIRGTASSSGTTIHHPSGDVKKITTYRTKIISTNYAEDVNPVRATHWKVSWSATQNGYGITEGGSSGAPLFNSDKLIIGTLTGGWSSCSSSRKYDLYGKMSYHWTSNGKTIQTQLKPWLDPDSKNNTFLKGMDYNDVSLSKLCLNSSEALSRIYPNPTDKDVNIELIAQDNPITINIYSSFGVLVYMNTVVPQTAYLKIPLYNIPKGLYIISYETKEKSWVDKLIVN